MSFDSYFLASLKDLMARNRWTAVWLTVHTGMAVSAPPRVKVQNVFRTLGSGLKLKQKYYKVTLQHLLSFVNTSPIQPAWQPCDTNKTKLNSIEPSVVFIPISKQGICYTELNTNIIKNCIIPNGY